MTALITAVTPVRRVENAVEYATPTVNTTFLLPSAANLLGKLFTFVNGGTANMLVSASDSSLVVTVQPGTGAIVTPLADTPTISSQWVTLTNGVSSTGYKGSTSGSAIATGNIGQVVFAANVGNVSLTTNLSPTDIPNSVMTLTAGAWIANYHLSAYLNGACSVNVGFYNTVDVKLQSNTNSAGYVDIGSGFSDIAYETGDIARSVSAIPHSLAHRLIAVPVYVPVGSTVLLKAVAQANYTGFTSVSNGAETLTTPFATRFG